MLEAIEADLLERGGDAVLLVGRIELIPPLAPGEQKIRAGSFGLDPFGVKETRMTERPLSTNTKGRPVYRFHVEA